MADPTNQNPNSTNSDNTVKDTQNKPDYALTNKFIEDYTNQLSDSDFDKILSQVASNPDGIISEDVKILLEKFKKTKKQFDGVDISWISYDALLRELVTSSGLRVSNNRKSLKELFTTLYKYKEGEKEKVEKGIDKLGISEILSLFDSEAKRDEFFKKTINSKSVKVKHLKDLIEHIKGIDWDKLTPEQQRAIKDYGNIGYASDELINLIRQLPAESKKSILLALMPTISLEELEKFSLITEDQSTEIIKGRISEILLRGGVPLDQQNQAQDKIKGYIESIDTKSIIIPISQALELASQKDFQTVDSVVDKLFDANKIETLFSEIHKHINEEGVKNRIKNREDFLRKLQTLQSRVDGLDNIRNSDGCVVVGKLSQEYGLKDYYLEIGEFRDKEVQVFERTHNNGIVKYGAGVENIMSYEDLFQTLVNLSSNGCEASIRKTSDIEEEIDSGIIKAFDKENEVNSLDELISAIDEIDSGGKNIKIETGMVFEFNGDKNTGDRVAIGRVTNINTDTKQIEIASEGPVTTFTFNEFLQAFSSSEGKRVTKITDFNSVIEGLQKHKDTGKFKDLIFKRGLILPKNQENNPDHPGVNTFANKDKKCIQVQEIHSNRVDVVIGELEEDSKTKKSEIKKGEKTTLSLEVFYGFITKHKLAPIIDKGLIKAVEPKPEKKIGKRYSVGNHIFGMQNFITIAMGVKQALDSFKSTLKENNELQAAEFALTVGKIFPASMRQDLENKVERAQQKKMKDKVDDLDKMTLGLSIEHVRKILETSNAFQHEIEAALMFVMKKHGCLYPMTSQTNPKAALYDLKGTYIWYEKLGGKIGDKMYQEYMRDMIADNREATEEGLIAKLLAKQGDRDNTEYYPKRRSTIFGEFNGNFKSGRTDSITIGEEEGKTYATLNGRKNLTIGKLKEGRHMFAVGCLKSTLDKGGNATEKNHVPFIMLMAGLPKKFHQKINGDLKGMGIANQLPALFFAQSPAHVDMYEKTALKFAKSVSDKCYDDLIKIVNDRNSGKTNERDIIDALDKYWVKYGDKLGQKFNTVDDNAFLLSQDDTDVKQYFELGKVVAGLDNFTKDSLENDVYDYDNTLMLYAGGAGYLRKGLGQMYMGSTLKEGVPSKVFEGMIQKLESIKNYKDPRDPNNERKNEEGREKLFIALNRIVALYVKSNKGMESTDYYKELKKMGLWLPSKENNKVYSYKDIESTNFDKTFSNSYKDFKEGTSEERMKSQKLKTALTVNEILRMQPKKHQNYQQGRYDPDYIPDYDYGEVI